MLIRSGLGVSFGIVFSVLLFKRRAWPAWVGLGFGAGRAWEECDNVSRKGNLRGWINMLTFGTVLQASCSTFKRWPPRYQAIGYTGAMVRWEGTFEDNESRAVCV